MLLLKGRLRISYWCEWNITYFTSATGSVIFRDKNCLVCLWRQMWTSLCSRTRLHGTRMFSWSYWWSCTMSTGEYSRSARCTWSSLSRRQSTEFICKSFRQQCGKRQLPECLTEQRLHSYVHLRRCDTVYRWRLHQILRTKNAMPCTLFSFMKWVLQLRQEHGAVHAEYDKQQTIGVFSFFFLSTRFL